MLHRIEEPDLIGLADEEEAAAELAAYAGTVEAVLRKEQPQWVQLTAEIEIPGQGEQPWLYRRRGIASASWRTSENDPGLGLDRPQTREVLLWIVRRRCGPAASGRRGQSSFVEQE